MTHPVATRRVGIVNDERYYWHRSHVDFEPGVEDGPQLETPEARRRLWHLLDRSGMLALAERIPALELDDVDLIRIHDAAYVERLARQSTDGGGEAGEWAPFGRGSFEIARLAAGGAFAAVRATVVGEVDTAFALVRPPGHHAERDRGRGYCLLANIPLAIAKARAELGVSRVAVVDWDVHHGNGTQSPAGDQRDALDEDYFVQLAAAGATEAFSLGYTLLLAPPIDSVATIRKLGVDGAILCDPTTADARIALFENAALPLVTVGRDISRSADRWQVRADSRRNIERLLEHLGESGARRVALLAPPTSWGYVCDSIEGFEHWVQTHDVEASVVRVADLQAARAVAAELLRSSTPPDAIIGLVERLCLGALAAAEQAGLRIPDDLRLACGADGRDVAARVPPITAIDIHPREQGRSAVRLLIDRIRRAPVDAPIISSSTLHIRASSARPVTLR